MAQTIQETAAEAADEGSTYSKDYWDLVFEQLGRNRLFKGAVVILTLMYASAIYAPILANDRPYVLEAANYSEYNKALRTLYPATLGLGRVAKQTPEEFLAKRSKDSEQTYVEALELESGAVLRQVEQMRMALPADKLAGLAEFESTAIALRDQALATTSARTDEVKDSLKAGATETKTLVKAIRIDYKPMDPNKPEEGGLELMGLRTYPILETISGWEMFFMVMWVLLMGWPLWNRGWNVILAGGDRERIRRSRKPKLYLALGLSGALALLWGMTVGGTSTFTVAGFKTALTAGDIVPTEVIFPPIPYGYAEVNSAEDFRPPNWVEKSEISEEGYYVHGARVPKEDPVTGYFPPPAPVEVRFAEPASNDPLRHILGTDSAGRDFLARLLWGGRVSLAVGLISAFLLVIIGTVIGAVAGYFGGKVDLILSRFIEIVLCIPALFLILLTQSFIDPKIIAPIFSIVILMALIRWTGVARLVRGEFLRLRESEFALAAQALGFSSRRTIFLHILPNAMAPVLVAGAFAVASGILTESTLSFLGFGIQRPMPSWGSLINESKMSEHWWIQIFPGLLIFITITCYNQIGDSFRDALDPKSKKH